MEEQEFLLALSAEEISGEFEVLKPEISRGASLIPGGRKAAGANRSAVKMMLMSVIISSGAAHRSEWTCKHCIRIRSCGFQRPKEPQGPLCRATHLRAFRSSATAAPRGSGS